MLFICGGRKPNLSYKLQRNSENCMPENAIALSYLAFTPWHNRRLVYHTSSIFKFSCFKVGHMTSISISAKKELHFYGDGS